MKTGTLYAIGLGAAYLWWRSRGAPPGPADDTVLPAITPTGSPKRPADNPLSDDEAMALKSGKAYLNKSGWLTYVGYDEKSTSGSVGW